MKDVPENAAALVGREFVHFKGGHYRSGMGVTLNFAHRKAWIVMVAHFIMALVPVFYVFIEHPVRLQSSPVFILLFVAYCVCYVVMSIAVAFRGASRDLKRYPGPKGPREPKGVAK